MRISTLIVLLFLPFLSLCLCVSPLSLSDTEIWSLPLKPPKHHRNKYPLCSTNAECFKKGLPPLKPRSKTKRHELKARQSASATTVNGIIQVLNSSGTPIGYVSGTVNSTYGGYGMTSSAANAMSVSFSPNGNSPVTYTLSSSQRPSGFPYLGAVYGGGTSAMNFASTDYSYAFVTAVNTVIPVGPAVASASNNRFNSAKGTETSLFTYNSASGNIAATWTNTNSAAVSATIIYDVKFALFYLISNFSAFQKQFPNEGEYVVTWKLIPQ
ncbi:uncharacterized protein IL334_006517 [Kwoniella shivajii]|uniref:DOMON domain-containing protein n=1 Tax=Kwoniella shivajii TaxID=564305 RepID=A0ABZ1D835_9TREE|nr:hypothetical protein IL334_006517 [Kwoniella shivajii]